MPLRHAIDGGRAMEAVTGASIASGRDASAAAGNTVPGAHATLDSDAAAAASRSPGGFRRGRFAFITIVALAVIGAGILLGRWQLSRAAQKEALAAQMASRRAEPPMDASTFLALDPATSALHRHVHLRGLWLPALTVYLDNRQMSGATGFYVLTPLAIEDSSEVVMVQRGFIPRNFEDRTKLAPVKTPAGLIEIEATIEPGPAHLLELGGEAKQVPASGAAAGAASAPVTSGAATEAAASVAGETLNAARAKAGAGNPMTGPAARIRQNLDLGAFRTETGLPLRTDVSLQQSNPDSEGLRRAWPAPDLNIERHYGYAFQWFGLATLFAILYVWFQLILPLRRARRRPR